MKEDNIGRILVAGLFGGIYRSANNGESWQQIYNGALSFDPRSVAVNSSGHIFVGSEGFNGIGFLRSTDDGASWQIIANALSSKGANNLLVMPSGEIFASTISFGLYRSTDNGATFSAVSNLPSTSTTDIEANSSGVLFVGTQFGTDRMYRSTDNGATWTLANNGLAGDVNDIFISGSGEIYAATSASVYRSSDNGATWTDINPPGAGHSSVVLSNSDIYASFYVNVATGGGVARSTDGGATWTQDSGLPIRPVGKLLNTSSGTLFAGGLGYGVYRRISTMTALGTDWEWKNNSLANTVVTSIGEDVISGNVYAGTQDALVFRSPDQGLTWESAASGILAHEQINSVAVNTDGTVFASGVYGGTYRSTNQGNSWASVYPVAATTLACNAQGHVFGGSGRRVHRSTNNGASWTVAVLPPVVQNIADIAFDGATVYVATGSPGGFGSQGVYRSTDNGDTWAAFNDGLPTLDVTTVAVGEAPPPIAGNAALSGTTCRISCGTAANGVFDLIEGAASLGGETWAQNFYFPTAAEVVELKRRRTYLAVYFFGWFESGGSCLGAVETILFADALCISEILGLESIARSVETIVLVGTYGAGILREVGGATNVDLPNDEPAAAPVAFHAEQPHPNPFRDTSTFSFTLPEPGRARVDVFDVSGRLVRTVADGARASGAHSVVWDGRDASGRDVGAGVYFYRLAAGASTRTTRTVLAR
ncbi:MAG: FlgD immunoglobulin-like domain containing protein [bacterium]